MKRVRSLLPVAAVLGLSALAVPGATEPSRIAATDMPGARQAQAALATARRDGTIARVRAEKLEAVARDVTQRADRTAREAAAIAARIQETEAAVAAQQARIALVAVQRDALRATLAQRQEPLARLTGSLQRLARRPPLLALLRPGSVRDTVYMRALLDTMLPEVERRTADLRASIARGRSLERSAQAAAGDLRQSETQLRERRRQLAALESRQRLASRQASGIAAREGERALALAERARDLGDLVQAMGRQGLLRDRLAALPGPVMRPLRPEQARVVEASQFTPPPQGLPGYMLPVTGRVVTGFGEEANGQARSGGLVLAPRAGAQVVSPAQGRVAFAGPYPGYHRIIIIEHEGGWTSLVTGLVRLDAGVGTQVVAGSPLGVAAPADPRIMVELRRNGQPVNPLQYLRPL